MTAPSLAVFYTDAQVAADVMQTSPSARKPGRALADRKSAGIPIEVHASRPAIRSAGGISPALDVPRDTALASVAAGAPGRAEGRRQA